MKRGCELMLPGYIPHLGSMSNPHLGSMSNPHLGSMSNRPMLHAGLPQFSSSPPFKMAHEIFGVTGSQYLQQMILSQQLMKHAQIYNNIMISNMFKPGVNNPVIDSESSVLLTPPLSENSTLSPSSTQTNKSPSHPASSSSTHSPRKRSQAVSKTAQPPKKKGKATRKINFTGDSPISGIIIRPKSKASTNNAQMVSGDIEAKYNVVDMSEESKKKLETITNSIGDYICQLCHEQYANVYQLAQHRCPSIQYIEYRCPECSKVFNCPANLASHRRWHKPKPDSSAEAPTVQNSPTSCSNSQEHVVSSNATFKCRQCSLTFHKKSGLATHICHNHDQSNELES